MSESAKESRPLRPWFPNAALGALRHEMNDLFENFFGETALKHADQPRVDVCETAEAVEVTTDVPGFKPEEIHVDVGENYLTISGEHAEEARQDDEGRKFHRLERRTGSFSRSVWLPCPVHEDKVDAHLASGVLTVRLPKREEAKRRKVKIKTSETSHK
jgi:HSP20 family protein